tara:strand:- start:54 stop:494 length:441 start_codon:yes stop_codon:yes gene_type:complete
MNAGERANLQEAVRVSRDPNATKEQVQEAGKVQRELRKKYPDTYGAIRGEMFENVTNMSEGGDTPKKRKKKVPAIAISIGMVDAPKNGKGKAAMMRGGMANKKEHMYSNGGSVTDNLKPLPKGLKGKGVRNLPDSVQMNMGFDPKS